MRAPWLVVRGRITSCALYAAESCDLVLSCMVLRRAFPRVRAFCLHSVNGSYNSLSSLLMEKGLRRYNYWILFLIGLSRPDS